MELEVRDQVEVSDAEAVRVLVIERVLVHEGVMSVAVIERVEVFVADLVVVPDEELEAEAVSDADAVRDDVRDFVLVHEGVMCVAVTELVVVFDAVRDEVLVRLFVEELDSVRVALLERVAERERDDEREAVVVLVGDALFVAEDDLVAELDRVAEAERVADRDHVRVCACTGVSATRARAAMMRRSLAISGLACAWRANRGARFSQRTTRSAACERPPRAEPVDAERSLARPLTLGDDGVQDQQKGRDRGAAPGSWPLVLDSGARTAPGGRWCHSGVTCR